LKEKLFSPEAMAFFQRKVLFCYLVAIEAVPSRIKLRGWWLMEVGLWAKKKGTSAHQIGNVSTVKFCMEHYKYYLLGKT
jgi:hypothetical protein